MLIPVCVDSDMVFCINYSQKFKKFAMLIA